MKLGNLIVLLVEPQTSRNIGSAARAMKNCGLTQLRLVRGARIGKEAKRLATHAVDVLDEAKRYSDFRKAIADAGRVIGFTSKPRKFGPPPSSLPDIALQLSKMSDRAKIVLVFGRENHGLLNEEMELCTDLVRIPADVKWPVYNLAQSVLLACYEIAIRSAIQRRSVPSRSSPVSSKVSRATRQKLMAEFEVLLPKLAYGSPKQHNLSSRILQRLSRQFDRSLLEEEDLQLWLAMLRRIQQRL